MRLPFASEKFWADQPTEHSRATVTSGTHRTLSSRHGSAEAKWPATRLRAVRAPTRRRAASASEVVPDQFGASQPSR
jgi:hypothetical protein